MLGVGACAIGIGGVATVATIVGVPAHGVFASGARALTGEVTVASPRPDFMQLPGQGAVLSGQRVVWTATNGQGATGSEADRIYAYDLSTRRASVVVRSHFGSKGFIGDYALVGNRLAYVDTSINNNVFSWRVAIADLRSGRTQTVAASGRANHASIAPQIAYDGVHLLLLETVDVGTQERDGVAILLTPAQHRQQVLQRVQNDMLNDAALAHNVAAWTVQDFSQSGATSRLTVYDMGHHRLSVVPVGNVTQVAGSGDRLAWLTMGNHARVQLYSLSRHRVLARDLAHGKAAVFPSLYGNLLSWTLNNGSSVQVYSLPAGRVIYSAPVVRHRIYGPTSASSRAVSWVYTMVPPKGAQHGYVVVHPVR